MLSYYSWKETWAKGAVHICLDLSPIKPPQGHEEWVEKLGGWEKITCGGELRHAFMNLLGPAKKHILWKTLPYVQGLLGQPIYGSVW